MRCSYFINNKKILVKKKKKDADAGRIIYQTLTNVPQQVEYECTPTG